MRVLLLVFENLFCIVLVLLNHPVTKYTINQYLNFSKKMNKSVLYYRTFYSEDGDHKPVDFNGETISFNCQIIEIEKMRVLSTLDHF